ncbi:MAG: hypothetical protein K6C36_01645, partial [Clostridia bacterium]|nr:hypothetical protein [Clostridia bacterium]
IREAFFQSAGDIAKSALQRDWASLDEPLTRILYGLFDPMTCDKNGTPYNSSTSTSYVWPTEEELAAKYDPVRGYTAGNNIYYSFDWRLDLATLADGFRDFLNYVLETTGAESADVIGSSMGACVLATYMDRYDCAGLHKTVFLSGAFRGASVAGDAFAGRFAFDAETMAEFFTSLTGRDLKSEMLDVLIDVLYQQGIVTGVTGIARNINDYAMQKVYSQVLSVIFGRIPGFWALIPAERYEEAKTNFIMGLVTQTFIDKIDYYHDVQSRLVDILSGASKKGVSVSILSKYGTSGIPAVEAQRNMTDMVVDTKYSSLGAGCALFNEPFDADRVQAVDDGFDRISPDRYIDASTCEFPEITWFLKNVKHTVHPDAEYEMLDELFAFPGQPTVHDLERYPQFLIFTEDGEITELTEENDYAMYTDLELGGDFWARQKNVITDVFRLFSLLAETIRRSLASVFGL